LIIDVPVNADLDPIDALAHEWVEHHGKAWVTLSGAERDWIRRSAALALHQDTQADRALLLQRIAEHALLLLAN